MTELSAELPAAIDLLVRREAVLLEAATSPAFNIDVLDKAMTELAEIH